MAYGPINATQCCGGMRSSEVIGFTPFGDVILKAQYVVFDLGSMHVSFAKRVLTS